MGKITDRNMRLLEEADEYESISSELDLIPDDFREYLNELMEEKGVSSRYIENHSNVSKSYVNELRNQSKALRNPSRTVVIDIGLTIGAGLDEINHLLKLLKQDKLYARDKKESIIIFGLKHKKTPEEIKSMLFDKGLYELKDK